MKLCYTVTYQIQVSKLTTWTSCLLQEQDTCLLPNALLVDKFILSHDIANKFSQ